MSQAQPASNHDSGVFTIVDLSTPDTLWDLGRVRAHLCRFVRFVREEVIWRWTPSVVLE